MTREFAVFFLDQAGFALNARHVREVLRAAALSAAPNDSSLEGLLNLRGNVIPVIDIRQVVGLPRQPLNASDLLVMLECGSQQAALRTEHSVRLEPVDEAAVQMADTNDVICGTVRIEQHVVSLLNAEVLLSERQATRIPQSEAE